MRDNITVDPALIPCPDMVNILDHSPLVEIVVLSAKLQKVLGGHCTDIDPLVLVSDLLEGLLLGRHTRGGRPLRRLWIAILL